MHHPVQDRVNLNNGKIISELEKWREMKKRNNLNVTKQSNKVTSKLILHSYYLSCGYNLPQARNDNPRLLWKFPIWYYVATHFYCRFWPPRGDHTNHKPFPFVLNCWYTGCFLVSPPLWRRITPRRITGS